MNQTQRIIAVWGANICSTLYMTSQQPVLMRFAGAITFAVLALIFLFGGKKE